MKTAFIFPGQGAQHVGMGKDLFEAFPAARAMLQQAEEITRLPLARLCQEGPDDQLARTDVAQPAIFVASAALLAALRQRLGNLKPDAMAGLSLGEYTALHAAGAIDFASAVALVARRGQLMQQAATASAGGMLALIGLDEDAAGKLCQAAADGQVLQCANFNCPGQIVLSGHAEACQRAEQLAKEFNATGATLLKVAGAFHSPLMAPAAEALQAVLEQTQFNAPAAPVIANVDAEAHGDPADIRRRLVAQLTGSVRWHQSMQRLLDQGVRRFYEIGPGRVLAGLMRRIDRKAEVVSVNSMEAVEKAAEAVAVAG